MSESSIMMQQVFQERGSVEHLQTLLEASEQLEKSITQILVPLEQQEHAKDRPISEQGKVVRSTVAYLSQPSSSLGSSAQGSTEQSSSSLSGKGGLSSNASLWNRNGFTPLPQVLAEPQENSQPVEPIAQQEYLEPKPEVAFDPIPPSKKTTSVTSELLKVLEEPNTPTNSEESQTFVPLAERLQRQQQTDVELERVEPDSSVPQSLDELYEEIPSLSTPDYSPISHPPHSPNVSSNKPIKIEGSTNDPELHAVVAPMPLQSKKSTSWIWILLVCLLCLLFGGIMSYFFLPDLAQFLR